MSFLNNNITESIQQEIYNITAKLGVPPRHVVSWLGKHVQANWTDKSGNSVMWRSDGRDWVEVYDGRSNPWTIEIIDL